jgi:protein-S-isoprenylcysteine O-methyltransferase Ste14
MNTTDGKVGPSKLAQAGRWIFPRRLFAGLAAVVVAAAIVDPVEFTPALGLPSLALIGMGLGLRAWAAACAGDHTREASISAPQLVTDGPYGMVRNPIYLGTVILGMGMVGLIGDWKLAPLLVGACVLLYTTIIPAEEQFLSAKFGAAFDAYRAEVPQLFPRWRKRRDAGKGRRVWANAMGDLRIGAILVAIYAFLRGAAWLREKVGASVGAEMPW